MDITLETLPKFRIAYVRQVGPYGPGNIQAMEALKKWAGERQLLNKAATLFGIAQDHPRITPPEDCRYDACIVISSDYRLDESVSEGELSGGTYAVFKIKHTAEDIQKAWSLIFPALHNAGYQMADKPILERYTGELLSEDYCEICVPIRN